MSMPSDRFFSLSPDLLCTAGFDGYFKWLNPAWPKVLGWSVEELLARPYLEFVHPQDREATLAIAQQVMAGQDTAAFENRYACRDGSYMWLSWHATAIVEEELIYAVGRDVTLYKQVQEQLRLKAAALEATADSIVITDRTGTIVWVNPAFSRLTGYSAQDAVGQNPRILKSGFQDAAFYRDLWDTILSGRAWRGQMINRRKDGSLYVEQQTINPLRDDQGRVAHFIGIKQDISRIVQREREMEAIAQIAGALRAAETREQVFPVLLDQVAALVQAGGVALVMRDPNSGEAVIEAGRGGLEHAVGTRLPPGEGVESHVIATGQPYLSDDVLSDPRFTRPDLIGENPALACVPLIAQEQIIGSLWVARQAPITQGELRLLTTIAEIAANAIHRAALYEHVQRQVQRLTALRSVDAAMSASLDLEATLDVLLEQATLQLNVDAADVLLLDQQTQVLEYAAGRGFHSPALTRAALPLGEGHAGSAALERRIIRVPNLVEDQGAMARALLLAGEGFITYFGVPLVARDQVTGVLEIFHRASLNPDAEWMSFLEAMAGQAAMAVEHARLFAETRRLLQQTQEQSDQLQLIMDTVPAGMLLLDDQQRVLLANPLAQAYLADLARLERGKILSHLNGRPVQDLLQPPPEVGGHELIVPGPPSHVFQVHAWPIQARLQNDNWVLVIEDVTRERQVQEQLREQDRLAAVGQLAAGIAHDFNNILTSIIGFAELARFQPETSTSIDADLERIIHEGQRAAHLVRQILDFSRKSISEKRSLHLAPLVKETAKLFERIIPESVHISLEIDPGDYVLKADPAQLQQVLTNLAINARDAMPSGGEMSLRLSHLTLQAYERPPRPGMVPGDWLVLAVSDSGVGISPEVLPHIFEPFFTTKEVGEGTGLGLAQVYGIVKQHGGEIEVTSQTGRGTTFRIYLPAASTSRPRKRSSAPAELAMGRGQVILLVEDDPPVLAVVRAMLHHLGYHPLTANNGEQALEMYEEYQDQIKVVLTDITMPDMDGVALAQALHRRGAAVKVIAMTGYPLEMATKSKSPPDIANWLRKPLSVEDLAHTLNQVLKD
jgi:PAS domain S-box-containing protein